MSNAFMALIWWVIPALGLIAALAYVLWVTKFEGKYRAQTNRSVDSFQKFQKSFGSKDRNPKPRINPDVNLNSDNYREHNYRGHNYGEQGNGNPV